MARLVPHREMAVALSSRSRWPTSRSRGRLVAHPARWQHRKTMTSGFRHRFPCSSPRQSTSARRNQVLCWSPRLVGLVLVTISWGLHLQRAEITVTSWRQRNMIRISPESLGAWISSGDFGSPPRSCMTTIDCVAWTLGIHVDAALMTVVTGARHWLHTQQNIDFSWRKTHRSWIKRRYNDRWDNGLLIQTGPPSPDQTMN